LVLQALPPLGPIQKFHLEKWVETLPEGESAESWLQDLWREPFDSSEILRRILDLIPGLHRTTPRAA
jgi:hypothetical protein